MTKTNPISVNISQAIAAGKYKNILTYPDIPRKPKEPPVFKMRIGDMTEEDMAHFEANKKEYQKTLEAYEADKAIWEQKRKEYNEEEGRLLGIFRDDCEATCFGVATGEIVKKKKEIVWTKAWEHGHANGFSEIWFWYDEFAEVANIV